MPEVRSTATVPARSACTSRRTAFMVRSASPTGRLASFFFISSTIGSDYYIGTELSQDREIPSSPQSHPAEARTAFFILASRCLHGEPISCIRSSEVPHKAADRVGRVVVGKPGGVEAFPFACLKGKVGTVDWLDVPATAQRAFPGIERILRERMVGGATITG
jgi:hypothetical protein